MIAEPFSLPTADLAEVLNQSREDLLQILERDIVILGASGFVGSWLTESVVFARRELGIRGRLVLVNRKSTNEQQGFAAGGHAEIHTADIRETCPDIADGSIVFFGANPARATLNILQPEVMTEIILKGVQTLLRRIVMTNCKIVNLSSGAVYGLMNHLQDCFDESDSERKDLKLPSSAYHQAKIDAERLFNTQASEGNIVAHARLFAFLSPKLPLNEHFAAGNFIRDALRGLPIKITGDERTVRSYQYATDLVSSLFAIAARGHRYRVYNVGSPIPVTILQLAEKISSLTGVSVSLARGKNSAKIANIDRYVPCTTRVETELGLKSHVDLDEAILRTVRWHQTC